MFRNLLLEIEDNSMDVVYINLNNMIATMQTTTKEDLLSLIDIYIRKVAPKIKETGFLFVRVEDNYNSHIKLLCDTILGDSNFLTNFCLIKNSSSQKRLEEENLIISHEYMLCYKKNKKAKLQLVESEEDFIHSRITKNGNKESILEIKKGTQCESNISVTYKGIIGGNSEPIQILNSEGMIIKEGVLVNDVLIKGPFCNPNYIKKYFNNEVVYDKRGQELIDIYLKKTGLPYTKKTKKGKLPTSTIFELWNESNEITEKQEEEIILKKIMDISNEDKKCNLLGLFLKFSNKPIKGFLEEKNKYDIVLHPKEGYYE